MWGTYLEKLRKRKPLVHCITNYVTVNDCANILLACGGSPIMADDDQEVEEITRLAAALCLNIGTLNARTTGAMHIAGKEANRLGIPVIFDPVGAGASALRTNTAHSLLDSVRFTLIRGNSSEIKALSMGLNSTKGVDADEADRVDDHSLDAIIACARAFSKKTGAIVVVTGEIDIVTCKKSTYIVRNGHPWLSRITGSGCMLTALLGAFTGANPTKPLEAAVAAVSAMGVCGEIAYEQAQRTGGGTASFRTALIDAVSLLDGDTLERRANIEGI